MPVPLQPWTMSRRGACSLDIGVISPTLFAMLVIMALVTTFATSPIRDWILRCEREQAPLSSQPASS